jgi:hypothetical protein
MAGTTGLEPATSAVTGQRSNQLSYVPLCKFNILQSGKSKNLLQASSLYSTKLSLFRRPIVAKFVSVNACTKMSFRSSESCLLPLRQSTPHDCRAPLN